MLPSWQPPSLLTIEEIKGNYPSGLVSHTLCNHIPSSFRISANPASFSKKSSLNWEGPRVCQTLVFHVLNRKENAYPRHKEQQEVLPQAWLTTTIPHSLSFQTFCSINRLKSDNKNIVQPLNRREKKKWSAANFTPFKNKEQNKPTASLPWSEVSPHFQNITSASKILPS